MMRNLFHTEPFFYVIHAEQAAENKMKADQELEPLNTFYLKDVCYAGS